MRFLLIILTYTLPTSAQPAFSGAQLEAQLAKRPDALRIRIEAANAYARERRPDKVIELLNPYTDQLNSNSFLLLASSYSAKNDYSNEIRILSLLSAKEDESYQWHMLLGQAYLKSANEQKKAESRADLLTSGIKQLRRVLSLNPRFKPAFDLLLNTLVSQKSDNEARELLMEGLNKFGERPELYQELCRLDSTDGFLVQAIENCRQSIHLSPDYPDHYVYLGQSQYDQQEEQAAERTLVNAAKHFPNSEFVQSSAGALFFRRKIYPVAVRYLQVAVKLNPKEARSQFNLAQALFESGAESASLEHFIAACKMNPSTVETFLSSGSRLKRKGEASNNKALTDLGSRFIKAANTCR